jgi:large subunit ribosomal protein L13
MTKTYTPKPKDVRRAWWLLDAEDAVLGRLASQVASILRGKHKPTWAPHLDVGDHVIVVNAAKVRLTGEKQDKKVYRRHSQYPGGLREISFERMMERYPGRVIEQAVRGMLPKNRLGRQMAKKLKVYEGPDHPHESQSPEALGLGDVPRAPGYGAIEKGSEA